MHTQRIASFDIVVVPPSFCRASSIRFINILRSFNFLLLKSFQEDIL